MMMSARRGPGQARAHASHHTHISRSPSVIPLYTSGIWEIHPALRREASPEARQHTRMWRPKARKTMMKYTRANAARRA
eukprot:6063681-Pyramimonas_sp.AAC.1